MEVLKEKKLWLFDMDGTIYKDDFLFVGTLDLINAIANHGDEYVFITNNSSKSVSDYLKKLKKLGVPATEENFFTSSQASAIMLKESYPDSIVYCQGTQSLVDELKSFGVNVTQKVEPVEVVLVGFDTEMTFQKLKNTCEILTTQDVDYYATNLDLVCPVEFGFVPDCGSICGMLKNATGRSPIYIGKPDPKMLDSVLIKYKYKKEDVVVVGDRLYTDILLGVKSSVTSICVLTGETTREMINQSSIKPTFVVDSVRDIADVLIR